MTQSYKNFDIVIVDDNSSDKNNKIILDSYADNKKITIIYKEKNAGISSSLNEQIIQSDGEWIAFLDCDDYLPKNALSDMVRFARLHPRKKLIFSNRTEVDSKEKFIRVVDFGTRHLNPDIFDELSKGMASSHLKMIKKDIFKKVGLFDSKYDGIQDYDMYLRIATYLPASIGHIDKSLYFHRIHDDQNTQVESKKHERNLKSLKDISAYRKTILSNGSSEKISIIILSLNRGDQLQKCVDKVLESSIDLNIEIIIWDNASNDATTISILRELSKNNKIKVHYSDKNLFCSGGRKSASKLADGEYLLFLDNDIEIGKDAIKELLISINEDKKIAASCCKVIFPDNKIQFNGATYLKDNDFIDFELTDNGKNKDDISTYINKRDCKWIPGGATLIRKAIFDNYEFDQNFVQAYEDNDFYMSISNDGYLLTNSPLSEVVHNHIQFDNSKDGGTLQYMDIRKSLKSLIQSWFYFYTKWGLIIKDEHIFYLLGISTSGDSIDEDPINNERLLEQQLKGIINSTSWKITKPLRDFNKLLK